MYGMGPNSDERIELSPVVGRELVPMYSIRLLVVRRRNALATNRFIQS
jgi:hypothetical protein